MFMYESVLCKNYLLLERRFGAGVSPFSHPKKYRCVLRLSQCAVKVFDDSFLAVAHPYCSSVVMAMLQPVVGDLGDLYVVF